MMAVVVWFRRDLRLSDHPALMAAVQAKLHVIPLYIWTAFQMWAPGGAGRWWLHHSLRELDLELKKRGSRLILRQGDPVPIMKEITAATGSKHVFWNRCYEPSEQRLAKKVSVALKKAGVETRSFHDGLLHEPGTILNKSGQPFRIFTPFWRRCSAAISVGQAKPKPKRIPAPRKWPQSLTLHQLQLLPTIDRTHGLSAMWTPGEAGAQRRLRRLNRSIFSTYDHDRERPDLDGTSCLSPHLHFGEVSPRQIAHLIQRRLLASRSKQFVVGAQQFFRQLYWREYAYDLLFHYPHLDSKPLREEFRAFPWRRDKKVLKAWQRGRTGYPMVDAGMRQLWHTGWMHNRVRMIVASFLVKDLLIHWLEGARWFWDTLVDADLANNSFGWQWVAGCGADAAPYFRIFNPVTQGRRYDPEGDYIRRWIPELQPLPARWIHCPWEAPQQELQKAGLELGRHYPRPIILHDAARKRALMAFQKIRARNIQSDSFRAKSTPSRRGRRVASKRGSL